MINNYEDFLNVMHNLCDMGAITEEEHNSIIDYVKILHDFYAYTFGI